jgi:multimeric flavodoxin WrbA
VKSTIALFSSARRQGNTGRLMDRVTRDLAVEVVDLARRRIAPYTYEHANRHDDFEPLMQHVLTFEQIVFASPIYWYSVTPQMKTFLDRISDYLDLPELRNESRKLRGKTGFVLCTSVDRTPAAPFIEAFQLTFGYLGMRYGGLVHADCADGYREASYEADVESFVDLLRHGGAGTAPPGVPS